MAKLLVVTILRLTHSERSRIRLLGCASSGVDCLLIRIIGNNQPKDSGALCLEGLTIIDVGSDALHCILDNLGQILSCGLRCELRLICPWGSIDALTISTIYKIDCRGISGFWKGRARADPHSLDVTHM